MKGNTSLLQRMRENRLFWPLVALALILIADAIFAPGFFKIGILDGHLYGNLIDVVNNAAPLMLVAIGMTLVIATGGVDLIGGRGDCHLGRHGRRADQPGAGSEADYE